MVVVYQNEGQTYEAEETDDGAKQLAALVEEILILGPSLLMVGRWKLLCKLPWTGVAYRLHRFC